MDFFQISGSDSLQNCRFRFGYPVLGYLSPTLIALNACPKLVKLEIAETPEMTTGELHFRNIHVLYVRISCFS